MKRITFSLLALFLVTLLCLAACSTEQLPDDSSSAISVDSSSSSSSDSSNTVLNGTGNTDESGTVESSNGTLSENEKVSFVPGDDYYPILISQETKNSLLFLGAFSNGELCDYEKLGVADLDPNNGNYVYDLQLEFLSIGDELTLYSSSGEKNVRITRVYVEFYRAAYPWIYVDVDCSLDPHQNYLCAKSGLKSFIANPNTHTVDFDLDSDNNKEQITVSFENKEIQSNDVACYYTIGVKGKNIDSENTHGGSVPSIQNEQYTIHAICDFDSDGIFEIVDYSNAYDDSANIWSVKENKIERLLHWS